MRLRNLAVSYFGIVLSSIACVCILVHFCNLNFRIKSIVSSDDYKEFKENQHVSVHVAKVSAVGTIYYAGSMKNCCFVEISEDGQSCVYVPIIMSPDEKGNFVSNEELVEFEDIASETFDNYQEGYVIKMSDEIRGDLERELIYAQFSPKEIETMIPDYYISYNSGSDYLIGLFIISFLADISFIIVVKILLSKK